jgi:hypothetical protein
MGVEPVEGVECLPWVTVEGLQEKHICHYLPSSSRTRSGHIQQEPKHGLTHMPQAHRSVVYFHSSKGHSCLSTTIKFLQVSQSDCVHGGEC